MDDDQLRTAVGLDPYTVLADLAMRYEETEKPIAIDEVQRVAGITLALKRIVDRNNEPGQFLLTGSSNIFTSPKALDSLAGRVMSLTLRPLSAAETMGTGFCPLLDAVNADPDNVMPALPKPAPYARADAIDLIVRGGFPEISKRPDKDRILSYRSYLDSIIEKDVPVLADIRKPDDLRHFINQLGARTATELNTSKISSDVGVTWKTLNAWLDVLAHLGIVHRLPGWTSSRANRAVKSPKLHFMDTGCATAIRNETADSFAPGADPTALGAMLESYVFIELEKTLPLIDSSWDLYHWRQDPYEVDIVAEVPARKLALFEMKASALVTPEDFKSIEGETRQGIQGHRFRGVSWRSAALVRPSQDRAAIVAALVIPIEWMTCIPRGRHADNLRRESARRSTSKGIGSSHRRSADRRTFPAPFDSMNSRVSRSLLRNSTSLLEATAGSRVRSDKISNVAKTSSECRASAIRCSPLGPLVPEIGTESRPMSLRMGR